MLNQEMLQTAQMEVQVVLELMGVLVNMAKQVVPTLVAEALQVVGVMEAVLAVTVVVVVDLMEVMVLWEV